MEPNMPIYLANDVPERLQEVKHAVALRTAVSAIARLEYESEVWQLSPAQRRACEGLASAAVGAYLSAWSSSRRHRP
jgi:hypothetical protein